MANLAAAIADQHLVVPMSRVDFSVAASIINRVLSVRLRD